ncbi:calcium-binding protein [Methylobacterium indicum]|uniref:calcium-binding protein n=2 Tax=Methylobacterium indicum TaxID=1775910 RepID=UPI003CC7AD8C
MENMIHLILPHQLEHFPTKWMPLRRRKRGKQRLRELFDCNATVKRSSREAIHANGGNDIIFGGGSDDALFGGSGRDTLLGGLGNDLINGDEGDDLIIDGGSSPIHTGFDIERLTERHDRGVWASGRYGSPASSRRSLGCNRPASAAAPASPQRRTSSGGRPRCPDRHPVRAALRHPLGDVAG